MRSNIRKIKKATGKKFLLMVKADAYGHGIKELVPLIKSEVDAFGVADTTEGITVLEAGADKPILVTGEYDNASTVVKYGFTPFVFSKTHITDLSLAANAAKKAIKAHIKADSGMGRFGSSSACVSEALALFAANTERIAITGIATHYASGELKDIKAQAERFREHITATERVAGRLLRHAASTASSLSAGGLYDMLRVGLGAYGYGGGLTPVMRASGKVIAVKKLFAGETSGYGGIYSAEHDTDIAIVGGGYADGISRAYIGLEVRIRGKLHRIVAVCMDNFIVELHAPCRTGDIAEIIYQGQGADKLAAQAGTITYEVLTAFRGRIERIIYDGKREIEESDKSADCGTDS